MFCARAASRLASQRCWSFSKSSSGVSSRGGGSGAGAGSGTGARRSGGSGQFAMRCRSSALARSIQARYSCRASRAGVGSCVGVVVGRVSADRAGSGFAVAAVGDGAAAVGAGLGARFRSRLSRRFGFGRRGGAAGLSGGDGRRARGLAALAPGAGLRLRGGGPHALVLDDGFGQRFRGHVRKASGPDELARLADDAGGVVGHVGVDAPASGGGAVGPGVGEEPVVERVELGLRAVLALGSTGLCGVRRGLRSGPSAVEPFVVSGDVVAERPRPVGGEGFEAQQRAGLFDEPGRLFRLVGMESPAAGGPPVHDRVGEEPAVERHGFGGGDRGRTGVDPAAGF